MKTKVTLSIDERILKAAKTFAATQENESLSSLVEKALTTSMPTVISVINPRPISPDYQAKVEQTQELVSNINAGTAPMNSLAGTVRQEMSDITYPNDKKT